MIGGYTRLVQDLPHFMLSEGNPALVKGFVIGLRRNGFSKEAIQEIKECHKLFYRSHKGVTTLSEIQAHTFKTKAEVYRFYKYRFKTWHFKSYRTKK